MSKSDTAGTKGMTRVAQPRLAGVCLLTVLAALTAEPLAIVAATDRPERPNILLAIADDWGWPHASAYGDPVVRTPTFDRLAREGILFQHAYASSPSCTPSRGALLTGQYHWRLAAAANLWSVFPDALMTYPEVLERSGYRTGHAGKAWGPGRVASSGRQLAGPRYPDFARFLEDHPEGRPFCFWLGSGDPHRPFAAGSGEAAGMEIGRIVLPACLPDHADVRGDVADYYFEVQRFDRLVGQAIDLLEARGLLSDTLVVMTSDHGMPFPRCKSNLYDTGVRVPLAIRWPKRFDGGQVIRCFASLSDLAPTFLDVAGLSRSPEMTGRSLVGIMRDGASGEERRARECVLFGKERHVPSQEAPDMGGYPCRAVRTHRFLFIRNYRPDRWPAGTPRHTRAAIPGAWLADCDNGPTKTYMVHHRNRDAAHRRLYRLAFAKRPAEELYDLRSDPHQLHNVADEAAYAADKKRLAERLQTELRATGDPRAAGRGDVFDRQPYLGGAPRFPGNL